MKLSDTLIEKGLRVTPQRLAVIQAIHSLKNHPSADQIILRVRKHHPNMATGTVYKTLETFVEKGILKKVKTEDEKMRYDSVSLHHHHLYCQKSNRIEDYYDEELSELINTHFAAKKIPDFKIDEIKLQITGTFKSKRKK